MDIKINGFGKGLLKITKDGNQKYRVNTVKAMGTTPLAVIKGRNNIDD